MKKLVTVLAAVIGMVGLACADSTVPTQDATTNVVGIVTVTSTNVQDVAPVPSGILPLVRQFKVSSGTLTFLGAGAPGSTNVTIGGGTATNAFITGAAVTFSSADGWVNLASLPTRDLTTQGGFVLGTYGGTAASGLVSGTVNTATIFYRVTGRQVAPSTVGGVGH